MKTCMLNNFSGRKNKMILIILFSLIGNISFTQSPCLSTVGIVCGANYNYSLPGLSGEWNPSAGPWGTPGSEAVFSYTPAVSGAYNIQVTNNNYYVDLFYHAGTCGPAGWTYVSDIYTSEINSLNLTAGVTYFFLIDDENTTASNGIISINCPCIPPPGGIDNSINIITNSTIVNSSTFSACNDCNYRSSEEEVLEVAITCGGDYTFTLCGGATWDTYIYLSDQPCGSNILAFNDDNCGLQSSITSNLLPGLYYLVIEGYSSASQGNYSLEVTTPCIFSPLPVELVYFEGENVGRENILSWQTASELNNDYFILERSKGTNDFIEIGVIQGHGTTSETNNYSFVDNGFSASTNYYRLTQVDNDGNSEVHNLIALQAKMESALSIFPNPSSGIISVSIDPKLANPLVIIQNAIGQIILEKQLPANNQITLQLNEEPGIYFINVISKNQFFSRKLIIQ